MERFAIPDGGDALLFPEAIARNARYFADRDAVVCGSQRLTWARFHERTNQIANALLGLGLERGDSVCLFMSPSIAMFEWLWGTVKAGLVTVPVNTMVAPEALPAMIRNARTEVLIADTATVSAIDGLRDELGVAEHRRFVVAHAEDGWGDADALVAVADPARPDVKIDSSDTMSIIYTSGTTGVPKGIEHSHAARQMYPLGYGSGLHVDRYAITLCATPLYANGTWILMLPTVFAGGTVVLLPRFEPAEFLEALHREHCTHTFLVPTQATVLLGSIPTGANGGGSLRVLVSAGQRLNGITFDGLSAMFPECGIYEIYGMTEGFTTLALPEDWIRGKRGSVGVPFFASNVRIIDGEGNLLPTGEVGEIVGYGPGLMKGYRGAPDATHEVLWQAPDGRSYLRSGDLGRFDDEGFLYIEGRMKDMIKSGGLNVFASDIEEVFSRHPDVLEVVAIGVPHPKWGETPLLLAILRAEAQVTAEELRVWGNSQLGRYQRVSAVELREDFPRAQYGKIRKGELREPYWRTATHG